MRAELRSAGTEDMACVVELVRRCHAYENLSREIFGLESVLEPLLEQGDAGRIWIVELGGDAIGYVALCFGYSIEFGGRDAFIDEFYILEEHRGRGIGASVLGEIPCIARELGVKALHLEVARGNDRARRLYRRSGFVARDKYHLMTLVL